jgi:hypothetical protein
LWVNPSKTFYKVYFALCLLCSLLFVASFIAIQYYNNSLINDSTINTSGSGNTTNTTNTTNSTDTTTGNDNNSICVQNSYNYLKSVFIIIGSIILFLNCIY